MRRWIEPLLNYHPLLTLFLMGLFGLGFGLVSINIFAMLHANFGLIARHGAMALVDGALLQMIELVLYGYLALVFYVLLKACEFILVRRLVG
jgi:hypothetical protein